MPGWAHGSVTRYNLCQGLGRQAGGAVHDPAVYKALEQISRDCRDMPVTHLADLWREIPADTAHLRRLHETTTTNGFGRELFLQLVATAST